MHILLEFTVVAYHDDIIKWRHFSRYWPFGRGIYRSPVDSLNTGQWRGLWFFFVYVPEKTMIWDAIAFIMRHCNAIHKSSMGLVKGLYIKHHSICHADLCCLWSSIFIRQYNLVMQQYLGENSTVPTVSQLLLIDMLYLVTKWWNQNSSLLCNNIDHIAMHEDIVILHVGL